jgi:hypothetical protein
VADASKFYKEKIDYVKASAAKLQETITSKQSNVRGMYTLKIVLSPLNEHETNLTFIPVKLWST